LWWVALSPLFWYNGVKENTMETEFWNKCEIISEYYHSHLVNDYRFANLNRFNQNYTYPLAYFIANGYVVALDKSVESIERLWLEFLEIFDVDDSGFDTLGQVLLKAGGEWLEYVQGEEESDDY
jgi:hypothetical protein